MAATKKKARKPKKLVHGEMFLDWKETPSIEDMVAMLEPFGLHVIEHPACEGTDSYGFIVSNRKLTEEEFNEAKNAL